MSRDHKAGSADPCGLEGQEGAEAAGTGWRERLAASSAAWWAPKVGEQTFQDQVKLLQLRGEAVHPNFSISGKNVRALAQPYLSVSFLCLSGINKKSSGCSFCKFHCILGASCDTWYLMANMSEPCCGSSKRQNVSLLFKAWIPGSRSWGVWFWGNELIVTPGNAMPPCPWRPRLVLATALSRATRRHECPPACQRWLSSCGSSRACLGSLPLSETQAQPLTWRTGDGAQIRAEYSLTTSLLLPGPSWHPLGMGNLYFCQGPFGYNILHGPHKISNLKIRLPAPPVWLSG